MRFMFPIFDWMHERGWITKKGTWRDYLVIHIAFVGPLVILLALVTWLSR